MSESVFGRLQNGTVNFLGLVGAVIAATAYGVNFKNDFDGAKLRVVQLETQVAELRLQLSSPDGVKLGQLSNLRGPQGEPGPRGPKGDPGEPGATGAPGSSATASVSTADFNALKAEVALLKSSFVNSGQIKSVSVKSEPEVSSSAPTDCVTYPKQTSGVFTITNNARICSEDGAYMATATLAKGKPVKFVRGGSWKSCSSGDPCKFLSGSGAQYIFDGLVEAADGGSVAKFSIYPN